jgi:hypothetical protein
VRSRRFGGSPNVLVGRPLGFRPGFVEMGDQQDDAVDLSIDVRSPRCRAVEARAIVGDNALEVPDDLLGLYKMMLDSRPRLLGRHVAGRGDGGESEDRQREEPSRVTHRTEAYHR